MKKITSLLFSSLITLSFSALAQEKQVLKPTADASIFSGDKARNYGSDSKLMVKRTKSGVIRHTFLKFDISSVDGSKGINKAIIKLYCTEVDDASAGLSLDISDTPANWEEDGLLWGNAPKPGKRIGNFIIDKKGGYLEADLTEFVKNAINLGTTEISIRISDNKSVGIGTIFSAKESKKNPPILEIL